MWCLTMSIRMVPDVGIAQNSVSKVDRLCYTYKGIVCKTGRRFYQAPNSLTTITIVSFFYAISHTCRAPRGASCLRTEGMDQDETAPKQQQYVSRP